MSKSKKRMNSNSYGYTSLLRKEQRQSLMLEEDMKPTPKVVKTHKKKLFEGFVHFSWFFHGHGWKRKYTTQKQLEQSQNNGKTRQEHAKVERERWLNGLKRKEIK